ncbi:hypothetical protein [Actinocorallia longicatena]|uniref:Uncharacterized protein n=1 Tax=Actinocorallia longicatena TaxID=111803 RepID=A0ABP6QHK3_9ACTN
MSRAYSRGRGGLGVFLTAAACMMTVASLPDFIVYAGVTSGTDHAVLAHLLDDGLDVAAFGIPLVYGIFGQLVGVILIGIALARGGRVPSWAGWLTVGSAPLLMAGYGSGVPPIVAVAYGLQLVTAVMAGRSILKDGIGWTRAA